MYVEEREERANKLVIGEQEPPIHLYRDSSLQIIANWVEAIYYINFIWK